MDDRLLPSVTNLDKDLSNDHADSVCFVIIRGTQ